MPSAVVCAGDAYGGMASGIFSPETGTASDDWARTDCAMADFDIEFSLVLVFGDWSHAIAKTIKRMASVMFNRFIKILLLLGNRSTDRHLNTYPLVLSVFVLLRYLMAALPLGSRLGQCGVAALNRYGKARFGGIIELNGN